MTKSIRRGTVINKQLSHHKEVFADSDNRFYMHQRHHLLVEWKT